ncbi:hypothetical protein HO173_003150 [Letharia columbiana]|uniref:Uncharacterized protein n=1 Tax=Letharia columbiana TaxID=112416 RepID=A0A8H6G184_9LECA|nr:uncharacterized protein HO173_003150 [Letharia columbiana]KAF6238644.1 hypothetical protein HO173_003150 [Letharia columbiana]
MAQDLKTLDSMTAGEDAASLPFSRGSDGLIWKVEASTGDHAFTPSRLCVPPSCVQTFFEVAPPVSCHAGFAKCYEAYLANGTYAASASYGVYSTLSSMPALSDTSASATWISAAHSYPACAISYLDN